MNNIEVVKTIGEYSIIKYYANAIYINNDRENRIPCHGDIFTCRDDIYKEYPNAEILEGFGVYNNNTGCIDEDADDWYDTFEDALNFIKNKL